MKFYNANSVMETVGEPIGDYTIVNRFTDFLPWICAWLLTKGDDEANEDNLPHYYWCQGHYFDTYEDAVEYAMKRK